MALGPIKCEVEGFGVEARFKDNVLQEMSIVPKIFWLFSDGSRKRLDMTIPVKLLGRSLIIERYAKVQRI